MMNKYSIFYGINIFQMFKNKYIYGLFGFVFTFSVSAATTDDIADGFSEFLIDRANVNLIYTLERRLKEDENFQCYFPNTYKKIEAISLENLFSSKKYWEDSLNEDLEIFIYRAIVTELQQGVKYFNQSKVLELFSSFKYKYEGELYPLNFIGVDYPQELRNQINGFYNVFKLSDNINSSINSKKLTDSVCQLKKANKEELKDKIKVYLELSSWLSHIKKYGKNLRFVGGEEIALICDYYGMNGDKCTSDMLIDSSVVDKNFNKLLKKMLEQSIRASNKINKAYSALESIDKLSSNDLARIDKIALLLPILQSSSFPEADIKGLQKIVKAAKGMSKEQIKSEMVKVAAKIKRKVKSEDKDAQRIIARLYEIIDEDETYVERSLVALELLEGSDSFDTASLGRLRKSAMFFSSIADSKDKEAVKNILSAYTLPVVSFYEKRKLGDGYFISSYFGYAAADSDLHNSDEDFADNGFFVPIGLEYNYGFGSGGSLSIMFSPLDMAYPVNLKFKGIEEDIELDEVIAPSITFAYGFEDYPVNIGVGYQRGRNLTDVNESEERYMIFLSFDMPLLRLY